MVQTIWKEKYNRIGILDEKNWNELKTLWNVDFTVHKGIYEDFVPNGYDKVTMELGHNLAKELGIVRMLIPTKPFPLAFECGCNLFVIVAPIPGGLTL